LLALGDADAMRSLALRVAAEDLSVRQTEDVVRRLLDAPPAAETPATAKTASSGGPDPAVAEIEEILSEQLATRVSITVGAKRGGKVVIEFGSADDLERIVSEIVGSGPGLAPD
jgi:ParB family chromosome partitioning protein